MNAGMRERLMAFARERIAAHVKARTLRAGAGMTEQEGMLGLRVLPKPEVVEDEPETWVLVIFAAKTETDSVTGSTNTPLEAVALLPRSTGMPALVDAVWWERTQLRDGADPPSTKTCAIEFFTRRFDPSPPLFPKPLWDDGSPYGGVVDLVLLQRVVGGDGSSVEDEVVRIYPGVGSGIVNFTASGNVPAETTLELRPKLATRVRT